MKDSDSKTYSRTPRTHNTFARGALRLSICVAVVSSCMSSHVLAEEVYNTLDAAPFGSWWGGGPVSDPAPDAGPDRTSQQFDLGGNHTITEVALQVFRRGTPTGSVAFEIWEDDGFGYPGQRVGTLGSIEDISTFEPADPEDLGSEPTLTFDSVVTGLNPALPHHVVIDYSAASGVASDGFLWGVAGGEEGAGPATLAIATEFPRLTSPLDDDGYGMGATPDLFSPSEDWIRVSDVPFFEDLPPAVQFMNFKMSVTAVPEVYVDGDANLDDEVNFADFLILSENFGQDGAWQEGDFDGDGTVGFHDFLALSVNFAGAANASAAAVPEPTAASLALFGLLGLIGFRKRR